MPSYKFGDVVLMKFPFTNNQTFKKRPALVIKDTNDGDVIVCRITSQLYYSLYDVELKDWRLFGLKLPSVIRVHKIASLEKNLIDLKLGEIDSLIKSKIAVIVGSLTQRRYLKFQPTYCSIPQILKSFNPANLSIYLLPWPTSA